MNRPILNHDFQHPSDGWYHLEARGEHPHRGASVTQVIDAEAAQSIAQRFNEAARAGQLRHGRELLIDHEHFSDQPDQETRAYGWLQELQPRADGIYGRIRWTATGRAAVDGGDYRFFSTEYAPADLAVLNHDPKRVRPLRLAGLTLTNMPNNRGQKPITNRAAPDPITPPLHPSIPATLMNKIATQLGLAPDASEDEILQAITKLLASVQTKNNETAPLKNRIAELEATGQTLLAEQTEALLDAHGVKEEKTRTRLQPFLRALKNRAERATALADLGFPAADPRAARPASRLLNRADAKTVTRLGAGGSGEPDIPAQTEAIESYRLTNRCSYELARTAIRRTKPELFGLA